MGELNVLLCDLSHKSKLSPFFNYMKQNLKQLN